MEVVGATGVISVPWFVALLGTMFLVAVMSKSMLANVGLIITAGLGIDYGWRLSGVGQGMSLAVVICMFCLIGFALFQILGRSESL